MSRDQRRRFVRAVGWNAAYLARQGVARSPVVQGNPRFGRRADSDPAGPTPWVVRRVWPRAIAGWQPMRGVSSSRRGRQSSSHPCGCSLGSLRQVTGFQPVPADDIAHQCHPLSQPGKVPTVAASGKAGSCMFSMAGCGIARAKIRLATRAWTCLLLRPSVSATGSRRS